MATKVACPKCGEMVEVPLETPIPDDLYEAARLLNPVRDRLAKDCQYEQTMNHGGR